MLAADGRMPHLAASADQQLQYASGKQFVDLTVAGNRLGHTGRGIAVPIVLRSVSNHHAAGLRKSTNQVVPFQPTSNSATLRTPGIRSWTRSSYTSRRCCFRSSSDSPCVQ